MEESNKKFDILGNLSHEIVNRVLIYNDPEDLVNNIMNCCSLWRFLMSDPYFWKMKCLKDSHCSVSSKNLQGYKKIAKEVSYWQGVYIYNVKLNSNWLNNIYTVITFGGQNTLRKVYYFDDEIIIFHNWSIRRNTISILDSSTGFTKNNLYLEDSLYIHKIMKVDDFVITVASYRSVHHQFTYHCSVWNVNSGSCILDNYTLRRFAKSVYCYKQYLIVYDIVPYVIDMNTRLIDVQYYGDYSIDLHHYNNLMVFEDTEEQDVLLYNLNSKILQKFKCCEGMSGTKITAKDQYLVLSCLNKHASIWNLESLTKLCTIDINVKSYGFLNCKLFTKKNIFICESGKFLGDQVEIRAWNLDSGTFIWRMNCNKQCNKFISTNNNYIFIEATRGKFARLFCPRTGKSIGSIPLQSVFKNTGRHNKRIFITDTKILIEPDINSNQFPTSIINYDIM